MPQRTGSEPIVSAIGAGAIVTNPLYARSGPAASATRSLPDFEREYIQPRLAAHIAFLDNEREIVGERVAKRNSFVNPLNSQIGELITNIMDYEWPQDDKVRLQEFSKYRDILNYVSLNHGRLPESCKQKCLNNIQGIQLYLAQLEAIPSSTDAADLEKIDNLRSVMADLRHRISHGEDIASDSCLSIRNSIKTSLASYPFHLTPPDDILMYEEMDTTYITDAGVTRSSHYKTYMLLFSVLSEVYTLGKIPSCWPGPSKAEKILTALIAITPGTLSDDDLFNQLTRELRKAESGQAVSDNAFGQLAKALAMKGPFLLFSGHCSSLSRVLDCAKRMEDAANAPSAAAATDPSLHTP
jgi:hypothetical protein